MLGFLSKEEEPIKKIFVESVFLGLIWRKLLGFIWAKPVCEIAGLRVCGFDLHLFIVYIIRRDWIGLYCEVKIYIIA